MGQRDNIEQADSIKKDIRVYLSRFVREQNIDDDDDLFTAGLLSSLFAMQMVLFVEKKYHITVENDDLDRKNFSTINGLTGFIVKKFS